MSDYSDIKHLAEIGAEIPDCFSADVLALISDLERIQRLFLNACTDMGEIGNALNSDMHIDSEEMLSMVFELRAERDQLKAENERLVAIIDQQKSRRLQDDECLSLATQSIDELRKDAERLDWLSAQGDIEQPGQGDVRAFIDAAMDRGENG